MRTMRSHVIKMKKMAKIIWPKLRFKTNSNSHDTGSIMLVVESFIPVRPILEVLESMTREVFNLETLEPMTKIMKMKMQKWNTIVNG